MADERIRQSDSVPTRRWEFLYRTVQFAGGVILESPEVGQRRLLAGVTHDVSLHRFAWEELLSMGAEARQIASAAIAAWCELFDKWHAAHNEHAESSFVFPDVYAVGFFLAVLEADGAVYYRGQRDARWQLVTSRTRESRNPEQLAELDEQAEKFKAMLLVDPNIKSFYDGQPLPGWHVEAACQHYEFPTHYLDFTTDFEAAAFFAEGARDTQRPRDLAPDAPHGAIYALPASTLPLRSTRLVVLPPCFPRPRLQRGVFIEMDPNLVDTQSFESAKYRFEHASFPLRRSVGNMAWGKSPGLGEFYYPVHDPYIRASCSIRGKDQESISQRHWFEQWVRETFDLCFNDRRPGQMYADERHLQLRCKSEPVIASRTFKSMVIAVSADQDPLATRSTSSMVFMLRSWAKALLHDGVLPPGMRTATRSVYEQHAWLHDSDSQ